MGTFLTVITPKSFSFGLDLGNHGDNCLAAEMGLFALY
ncbi:hypothetical protein SeseC_00131 [Streptococcus equi subsp. zooepidemicus ATCC 35246]|nr:hypothetical protein SeseC_00131 [Streptococcus equi subsp. zooepidemicus ATCC 35246]